MRKNSCKTWVKQSDFSDIVVFVWQHKLIFRFSHSGENLFKIQSRIFLQNPLETFVEAAASAKKRCYYGNKYEREIFNVG